MFSLKMQSQLLVVLLLVLFGFCPRSADASSDVLYWIVCTNCDPTQMLEARQEIIQQAGDYSCYGESCGFSPGDEFIVENEGPPMKIERWKYTAANTYINTTAAVGFVCDNAPIIGGVGTCVDLTPNQKLDHPPWVVPAGPHVHDVWWTATCWGIPVTTYPDYDTTIESPYPYMRTREFGSTEYIMGCVYIAEIGDDGPPSEVPEI